MNGLNGIHIPRWMIAAVVMAAAILGAGFQVGSRYTTMQTAIETIETRMCRIERALDIPEWPTCLTRGADR